MAKRRKRLTTANITFIDDAPKTREDLIKWVMDKARTKEELDILQKLLQQIEQGGKQ